VPLLIILLALGTFSNFLVFDPKFPNFEITFLWLIKMLFLTIFPEEFFFRFFIQNNIILLLKKSKYCQKYFFKNYQIVGVIIASIFFGLAHFKGGLSFVLLATICGFFYGFIFVRTRYIEASILLHFLINLTHFLFFSYPFAIKT
jgi:membrane protease YdiL (CAAX protease family)